MSKPKHLKETRNECLTLKLPRDFVSHLMEGLEVLIDEWDYTYRAEAYGEFESDQIFRECNSAAEARKMSNYYRRIMSSITKQIDLCSEHQ